MSDNRSSVVNLSRPIALAPRTRWLDVLRDYHGSIRSHNFRRFLTEGGLISFGIDQAALYRLAASYVATAS